MDEKTRDEQTGKDPLKEGFDRLEEMEINELTGEDLDSVAGGDAARLEEVAGDCSSWCCSSSG